MVYAAYNLAWILLSAIIFNNDLSILNLVYVSDHVILAIFWICRAALNILRVAKGVKLLLKLVILLSQLFLFYFGLIELFIKLKISLVAEALAWLLSNWNGGIVFLFLDLTDDI